jgi:2-iminobutanoate/2-iminopropanoate deaminase
MEHIHTTQAPAAVGPYSQAVRTQGFLFCSGQIPLKQDGTLVSGGIEEQTQQVCENLKAVLSAAGVTLADVVKTEVYLKDMNDFAMFNQVYATYFTGSVLPARVTVEVARLPKDARVEISCVALTH